MNKRRAPRPLPRLIAAAVCLFSALAAGGCLKPVSLDVCGYVSAIAVDEGRDGEYYFTLALQRELAEQNIESEGGAILLADSGEDLFEAVTRMQGSVPYTINFTRANFIVVSRELAERGLLSELARLDHDRLHIRTSAAVMITQCRAYEFLGAMYSNNDADINKLQSALTLDGRRTGMVRLMPLSRLIEAERAGTSDFCTALGSRDPEIVTDMEQKRAEAEGKDPAENVSPGERVGGLKAFMTGTALFSGARMTGALSRDETLFLNLMMGRLESGFISADTPKGRMTAALTNSSSRLAVRKNGEGLLIVLTVRVLAEPLSRPAELSRKEAEEFLQNELPAMLAERVDAVFAKLRAAGCDPLCAAAKAGAGGREYAHSELRVTVTVKPAA